MRLIDRYLLRELLIPLFYCLTAFLIFWIAITLSQEMHSLQKLKLHGSDIALYYLVKAPEYLVITTPISLLLAMLYALTNHARHHELTAIRGAGISLWRTARPYFVVGIAASLFVLFLNEICVPQTEQLSEQILSSRVGNKQHNQFSVVQTSLAFKSDLPNGRRNWQIRIYNTETSEMIDPKVDWELPNGGHRELLADRAIYTNGAWNFFNLLRKTYVNSTNAEPFREAFTDLVVREFSETPDQIKSEIKITSRLAKRPGKRPDMSLIEIWNYFQLHSQFSRTDKNRLYTNLHGRLATPWTSLVVVLIAIPFGAPTGRRNAFVGVASSIVICFAFFIVQWVSLFMGYAGWLQPWLAGWLPNLLFGSIGALLTFRVR
jgi:lipopolysaccharide export system permease protein